MAHIIPNEQHSKRVLYPTALTEYKEKQFTGCPDKVQLSTFTAADFAAGARKLRRNRERRRTAFAARGGHDAARAPGMFHERNLRARRATAARAALRQWALKRKKAREKFPRVACVDAPRGFLYDELQRAVSSVG
jgi:hypothetical protein